MHVFELTLKLVDTDRPSDRPTDIVTYRAAIAAKNTRIEKIKRIRNTMKKSTRITNMKIQTKVLLKKMRTMMMGMNELVILA